MIKATLISSKELWEEFVLHYRGANFLHSWNWGEFQRRLGKNIFRLGFFRKDKLKGAALLIKQEAKRGVYLECPGGPLIEWEKPIFFEEFVRKVREIGYQQNCIFARVRPQILETLANHLLFKKYGFVSAPMHLHAETTLQLNLNKTEEQLLFGMRKNTRYLIKKAIQEGVKIVQSREPLDINILYQLQLETVARRHFVPFSQTFFQKEFQSFFPDNQISLFKALWKNKVLAAALIIFYGQEAVYHYSGSSSKFRKIPASYLLQWEAIREAKKRGCKVYNFWGIAPSSNPHHRFAGVTLFKKGFGGEEVSYLPAHDLPLRANYWLVNLFERLRRVWRRL